MRTWLPLLLLLLSPLAGCATSWTTFEVYAPYDTRLMADAEVAVVPPLVTTRPDQADLPWGKQADRFEVAILDELDGPFLSATAVDATTLGWTEETWGRLDDVAGGLLAHQPNPFPDEDHRVEEGNAVAGLDELGADGYVLLVAVQPSMKETLARLMGVAGEVTSFAGFVQHLDEAMGDVTPDPTSKHEIEDFSRDELTDVKGKPVEKRAERRKAAQEKKARQMGKQDRVDVAFLLVDRRSGRFVAAQSARLEPSTRPFGNYRGAVRRALMDWRLMEETGLDAPLPAERPTVGP